MKPGQEMVGNENPDISAGGAENHKQTMHMVAAAQVIASRRSVPLTAL
jgi:hypothetical protein